MRGCQYLLVIGNAILARDLVNNFIYSRINVKFSLYELRCHFRFAHSVGIVHSYHRIWQLVLLFHTVVLQLKHLRSDIPVVFWKVEPQV
jgi:hypothetical protein